MALKLRKFILLFGDIFFLYLSLLLTVVIGFWPHFTAAVLREHFLPFSFLYFFWLLSFYIFDLYDLNFLRSELKFKLIAKIGEAVVTSLFIGISFFYTIPFFGITPKTNLLINVLIFSFFAYFWRKIFSSLFATRIIEKVIFLGKEGIVKEIIKKVNNGSQLGYRFAGFIDRQKPFIKQLKLRRVNAIIILDKLMKNDKILKELYKIIPLKIGLIKATDFYELIFQKTPVDSLSEKWFLDNLRENRKRIYDIAKRGLDVFFAFLFIVLTLPFWLIIPLLIKIDDDGKIFYKQKRIGKDGRVFYLWKFRSMKPNSENKAGLGKTREDDKRRITRIGEILRQSHFDELPQLINVLKGDISIVGPRPERPKFVREFRKKIPYYDLRHIIKPGITGWAQIKYKYARSIKDSKEKLEYDLYYIKNRSLILDLGIILKTIQTIFRGDK